MSQDKNDNTKKLDSPYYLSSNNNKSIKKNSSRYVVITKEIFEHGPDKKIPFNLVRSKRRKTSEIIIENEAEITVRVPFDKPMEEINGIIQKKIQWIFRKQEEYKRTKPDVKEYSYVPLSTLPYLGHNYEITLRKTDSSTDSIEKVDIENDRLVFYLKGITIETNKNNESILSHTIDEQIIRNKIKKLYEIWLYGQGQIIFKEKINRLSKIVQVSPNELQIKKLKKRWGSLTKNKIIILNVNLVKAPEDIIDYIILHELSHLKIEGHSHNFWKCLKLFQPDYENKIKWLEINGKDILVS